MHELRSVTDDSPPFEIGAGLEAGRVDESQQRHVERVAPLHESCALLGGGDVERSRPLARLVRDHSDGASAETREAGDEVRRVAGTQLEEAAVIDDVGDDVAHVVRGRRPVGQDRSGAGGVTVDGIVGEVPRRVVEMMVGQVVEDRRHRRQRVGVIVYDERGDAAAQLVDGRAPERGAAHGDARERAHRVGAGDVGERVAGHHDLVHEPEHERGPRHARPDDGKQGRDDA